ncbi:MAG: Asp-tRNA(Asn)/Glu-tRNA(Gln) amidotransferase subunit GatA [Rickettsiales bacterium]|nr:Asp-tRNA(Asn)/Glu-tRNA(Gln) amidotransferase subunit GatA [Rickettsiales bacterium]
MTELTQLTLTEMRDQLRSKSVSSKELTQAHLDAIYASDLNAFTVVTDDIALAQAEAADKRLAAGEGGLLEGVPLGVKDLFCTKGVLSTAGSHILDGFKPEYESTITSNMFDQGAVMVGKLNMDEFAMGSSNETSYYGPCKNPWKRNDGKEVVPGGSSGGSAAAVAANLCPVSLGTDTGGSIRQPAAFCGIVGVKPTYGRCSRWGIVAFASSLDQAGPFARNVTDASIALQAMMGHDAKDSTSAKHDVPDLEKLLKADVKGLRVGIPEEYRVDGINDEIATLWDKGAELLKAQGAEIVPIKLPHTKYALPTYYIVAPAEASSNLARYDGVRYGLRVVEDGDGLNDMYEKTRAAGFGDEVKRRIMIGTYVLSAGYYDAYYKKAQRVRQLIANDFKAAYESCDVILTPTAPSAAFALGEKQEDPIAMYLNDVFTVPTSLAGLPGVSIPAGLNAEGLPLGLQLIGRSFDEVTMLNAALALEEAVGFNALVQEKAA